jgi:hypothetical protein
MLKAAALIGALILTSPAALAEDPVGRYQMIVVPANQPGEDPRVLLLDTRDGHLWQWRSVDLIADNVSNHRGNGGVTYLGKLAVIAQP